MKTAENKYGIPIVNPSNILDVLRIANICPWRRLTEPMSWDAYLTSEAPPEDKQTGLAHKSQQEVVVLEHPITKKPFIGLRRRGKDSAMVYAFSGNFMIAVAEFKHGVESVTLALPGGFCNLGEKPEITARREFEEETGIAIGRLAPLSVRGIPVNARTSTGRHFSFAGLVVEPIQKTERKLDADEIIEVVLMSPESWMAFVRDGLVDTVSAASSLLAFEFLRVSF